ncbi:protease 2 [Platysternon megacephalum]|uniref:Protease 2 n=1 Tax=Platysternon megacephalum TaxID=55544 RepID=A0A4D9DJV8_9SAUR|nr:protease 2 [Platysternon megacephalum]
MSRRVRNKPFIPQERLGFPLFNATNLLILLLMQPELSHFKAPSFSEASGFLFSCTSPDLAAHISLVAKATSKSQIPAESRQPQLRNNTCRTSLPCGAGKISAAEAGSEKRGKKVIGLL